LGDLEKRVMEILWEQPTAEHTARSIADRLPDFAYTTIATVLDRLTNKGMARRRKEGRVIQFVAVDTKAAFTVQAMLEALESSSDPSAALAQFAQAIDRDQAAALRDALNVR
jgi:predicted transcriptional regulator